MVFLVVVSECLCVAVFCDVGDVADCENPDCCWVLLRCIWFFDVWWVLWWVFYGGLLWLDLVVSCVCVMICVCWQYGSMCWIPPVGGPW